MTKNNTTKNKRENARMKCTLPLYIILGKDSDYFRTF